jgi:predicted CXXCH cytochrome family protein
VVGSLLIVVLGAGLVFADWWTCLPDNAQATYVGRQQCITCHQDQNRLWEGSHHDLAMDRATESSVLGDFADAALEHQGVTSKMFKKAGKYFINTEGPDGENADFEIKYVFGVEPLQQYMVEFDRTPEHAEDEIARLQVLRVCWNTLENKWFHLPPPDVKERLAPSDDLHWTGVAQRWNNMCGDCHTTNYQKDYRPETKSYHTKFSEMDVSCEACHGPGSLHVQLAKAPSLFWDRKQGYALARLKDKDTNVEIETCAACHSRRRTVQPGMPGGAHYHDYFAASLITSPVYHADGQQTREEAYEYGSFLQSKMYHKGIRCTDCHNPHTAKVKYEGNQLCTSCHAHPASKYDTFNHHRHKEGSAGAKCVECHMPSTTYMECDARRDHSLRIPRPDLSVKLGMPNACTGCHIRDAKFADADKREALQKQEYALWLEAAKGDQEVAGELKRLDAWCDRQITSWLGEQRKRPPHFVEQLSSLSRNETDAPASLAQLLKNRQMPAIARATAAQELGAFVAPGNSAQRSLKAALEDPSSLVRLAAVQALQGAEIQEQIQTLTPLLSDPARMVRIEAARALAGARDQLSADDRRALMAAVTELKASLAGDNDRAMAHVALGYLYESLGDDDAAEAAYRLAMTIEPAVTGPRSNLAGLLDRQAEKLQQSIQQAAQRGDQSRVQQSAALLQDIGAEVRQLRGEEADLIARDAALAPQSAALQYRLGMTLILIGKRDEAEAALRHAVDLEPQTPQFAYTLAILYKDTGRTELAIPIVEELLTQQPGNLMLQQLRDELKGE